VIDRIRSRIKRVAKKAPADATDSPEPSDADAPAEAVAAHSEATPAQAEAAEPSKARTGRSRRRTKPAGPEAESAPEAPSEPSPVDQMLGDDDLIVLSWRTKDAAAPAVEPAAPAEQAEGLAPRRSRRRRRKELQTTDISAAAALQTEPAPEPPAPVKPEPRKRTREKATPKEPEEATPKRKPPEPLVPPKPPIRTPEDAPQVVPVGGVPTLVRDKRVYPPIAFFGSSPDEKRARTVLEQIRMAADGGIHIHVHLIELDVDRSKVDQAVGMAAYLLSKTVEADPEAQVLFRVVFIAPHGWADAYPDAKYTTPSGQIAEPSVCDEGFWGVARDCLRTFVQKLRMLPAQGNLLGIHLERGEWFYAEGSGYDSSPAARRLFRRWTEIRYLGDVVTLRAAWFDGQAQFENLEPPTFHESPQHGEKFVRSNRKERRWVDYHLFLSDATVQRITDLAYTVKEASQGYFLVGVSYGYTFEWSHPASGHLSLGKLLRTSEIDFIGGPPSYRSREPDGTAPFPCPVDSLTLNGKLYISEEDFKTSIGEGYVPDDFNPVIKTPQALESVHWRGAGAALAHGSGVCWMDLWGNGWLKTANIWSRGSQVKDLLTLRLGTPIGEPDVAVFVDERALAYLVDRNAFQLLVQNVREAVLLSGLSAGFYLLSDLAHRESFPESKLYVFLNAWDIRSELRGAIKSRLQRDNKVLFWLYAAGLFDSGRASLERAREVTGIALKPQPFFSRTGTTILNRRHPLCEAFPDKGLIGGAQLEPSYFGIPEDATVLGEYSHSGLPSFLLKEFKHDSKPELNWKSVFLGEPVVTPALLRALGQLAGCHVWNYQEDLVHVRPPFLTVHCRGAGQRTITLPNKWSAYDPLSGEWAAVDSTSLKFAAGDGSTHVFLVGPQVELEGLIGRSREELLTLAELPTKPDNTARFDAVGFDVPIVKLDEWIEGGIEEDFVEEWLFKPSLVDEEPEPEPEEPQRTGRRRRRRGRGGGGSGNGSGNGGNTEEPAQAQKDIGGEPADDMGVHVMFRKRD
jgi:hypothetical protein